MAWPADELVFTFYGNLPANPASRPSASAIVLLTGPGSEKFPMFSLAAISWRARTKLASDMVEAFKIASSSDCE